MSYDLELGFREKPQDLDRALSSLGFHFSGETPPTCRIYTFEEGNLSLDFTYVDGVGDPEYREEWAERLALHEIEGEIVASGHLRGSFSSAQMDEGVKKMLEIGVQLRDTFDAVLYNPAGMDIVRE